MAGFVCYGVSVDFKTWSSIQHSQSLHLFPRLRYLSDCMLWHSVSICDGCQRSSDELCFLFLILFLRL